MQLIFGCLYAFIAALLFGVATNVKSIQTSTVGEVTVKGAEIMNQPPNPRTTNGNIGVISGHVMRAAIRQQR